MDRSAWVWRRLSREVSRLCRLMKKVPDASMLPSGPGALVSLSCRSRSNVRSLAIAPNGVLPTYSGLVTSVMPCRGWSIAITAKPIEAIVSARASILERLPVMPCWKITTGQPASGRDCPELAFGKVISSGTT